VTGGLVHRVYDSHPVGGRVVPTDFSAGSWV
jgi:hypothetical protein